jgi:hypothetical protein
MAVDAGRNLNMRDAAYFVEVAVGRRRSEIAVKTL